MPLPQGTQLGPYTIVALLGQGGMGVVYRARDERLQRDVAIKVLPPGLLSDEPAKSRFRKEARALARLSHPNIAAVFDVGEQDGMDYLVMECVPGQTLSEKMRSQELPAKEILSLGVQVAGALEEAHEQGVVHRDLKPSNIMVTPKGHAKVLDFGLAKLLEPVGSPCTNVCRLDKTTGLCEGCFRNREEIKAWKTMSDTDKLGLFDTLVQRQTDAQGSACDIAHQIG